jgi:signal transduction histidine kinase
LKQEVSISHGIEVEGIIKLLSNVLGINQDSQQRSPHEKILEVCISALSPISVLQEELVSAFYLLNSIGDGHSELQVVATHNYSDEEPLNTLPVEDTFISHVINGGQPRLLLDGHDDPVVKRINSPAKYRSYYCVPASKVDRPEALLLFAHPHVDFFTSECRQILTFIGSHVETLIKNFVTLQKMISDRERIFEIQKRSRKKLARELHDGAAQSIAALAMRMNIIRRLLHHPSTTLLDELDKVEELARQTTREMRHLLFALYPNVLETQGLEVALNDLSEKMFEAFNQKVLLVIEPDLIKDLTMDQHPLIFDLAVELVDNSRKHAHANNIWLRLKRSDESTAMLEIEDDGVGFELKENDKFFNQGEKLGLLNVYESVKLFGGGITIGSTSGKGTIIQVSFPLKCQNP